MNINCPECKTANPLPNTRIGQPSFQVTCEKCGNVITVQSNLSNALIQAEQNIGNLLDKIIKVIPNITVKK